MSDPQNSLEDDFDGAVPSEALQLNSAVTESLTASGTPKPNETDQTGLEE
jgi:hypothetical protein